MATSDRLAAISLPLQHITGRAQASFRGCLASGPSCRSLPRSGTVPLLVLHLGPYHLPSSGYRETVSLDYCLEFKEVLQYRFPLALPAENSLIQEATVICGTLKLIPFSTWEKRGIYSYWFLTLKKNGGPKGHLTFE